MAEVEQRHRDAARRALGVQDTKGHGLFPVAQALADTEARVRREEVEPLRVKLLQVWPEGAEWARVHCDLVGDGTIEATDETPLARALLEGGDDE